MFEEPAIEIIYDPTNRGVDRAGVPRRGLYIASPRKCPMFSGHGPDELTALERLGSDLRRRAWQQRAPATLTPFGQLLAAAAVLSPTDLAVWLQARSRPAALIAGFQLPEEASHATK